MSESKVVASLQEDKRMCWFVMRDLKRVNAKHPAYKLLRDKQIEVFTPMKWRLTMKQGKRERELVPFIPDLLFVHDTRENLDSVLKKMPTLQYRYVRGGGYCDPMIVNESEMQRFMLAVGAAESPCFFLPEEITPDMYGCRVRILGGPLVGYEGYLLSSRGTKIKRLLVGLPHLLSTSVEIAPEYIEVLK